MPLRIWPCVAPAFLVAALAHAQLPQAPEPATAKPATTTDVTVTGKNGAMVPPEPKRILGILPNYRSVTAGTTPPPASTSINLHLAKEQSLDYSAFAASGLSALISEARNSHPTFGKGPGGYGQYLWRANLDRTDATFQSTFLFPTLFHEDPRYYAMEQGNVFRRLGYAASRVVVTRTYSGHDTFNFAGVTGRVGSELVSRTYYPKPDYSFGSLAVRFGYASARAAGFTMVREFYPDLAARFRRRSPSHLEASAPPSTLP